MTFVVEELSGSETVLLIRAQLRKVLQDLYEPVRVSVRKRFKQHAVDDAEDGRVRADAERQRQTAIYGEAGLLHQHSRAVAQVLYQRVSRSSCPWCRGLLMLIAGLPPRVAARFASRSAIPVQGSLHFEMETASPLPSRRSTRRAG